MDIPQARFPQELLKIINEIAESHFVAFDLEFSGVAGRRPVGTGKLSLQELYEDTKAAAEKYQILQVGLTIVKEDLKHGRYVARPYNFNISPLTGLREKHFGRVWSHHSGAISFLTRHGFDFSLPITQGVQYLSRSEEQVSRSAMIQEEESRSKIADMELKAEDDALINHIRSEIRKWQAQPKAQQEDFLNIPAEAPGVPTTLNRYQVRLVHQVVRNEHPGLKTHGMGHFVQVTNPTEEQQVSAKQLAAAQREADIAKAIGFRWVVEAMVGGNIAGIPNDWLVSGLPNVNLKNQSPQDFMIDLQERVRRRRRVLVGHNCFTDLVNFYKCFIGQLPDQIEDFQDEIHSLFPGVIDTKFIASFGNKKWGNTSLEDVELDLRTDAWPRIDVPAEYDRYQYAASYHEAGYDSLLTARIAVKLPARLEREKTYLEAAQEVEDEHQPGFGCEEDGYMSAAESIDERVGQDDGMWKGLSKVLTSPVAAAKALFDRNETDRSLETAQTSTPKNASSERLLDSPHEDGGTTNSFEPTKASGKTSEGSEEVIAVRERSQKTKWSNKDEVEKVKKTLARSNIYDALEDSSAGPERMSDDSAGHSSDPDEVKPPRGSGNVNAMISKGKLMPRWDDANGFWKLLGNRLQVNAAKERVCRLD